MLGRCARLLLKGLRISTLTDLRSARFCRVEGFWSCFAVQGDDPRRDKLDPSSAVISGEYTGGWEDSTGGMAGGGSGADGSLGRGWRRLGFVGWSQNRAHSVHTFISSRRNSPFLP